MATSRIAPKILQNEYDAFLILLKDDLEFPTAYGEWLERTTKELEKRRAKGEIVRELTIHPQEFSDWCRRSGVNPSLATFRAFAVAKISRQD